MAARYRKIDPRIWKDEKLIAFNRDEKIITLYCLTAQSNRIGIFNFSPAQAAEDLTMTLETFRERFGNVCRTLKWEYDERHRILYLPTWWKYNPPENRNNVIGNLKDLDDLPESPLIPKFCDNLTYLSETLRQTFTQTLLERYPKRSASQEQEQEQEKEKGADAPPEKKNIPPKVEDVRAYCLERKNGIDPVAFMAHYKSKNWMIGKNKMVDWQAAIITWERRNGYVPPEERPKPKRTIFENKGKFYELLPDGTRIEVDRPSLKGGNSSNGNA
jgi:hypothetical protein